MKPIIALTLSCVVLAGCVQSQTPSSAPIQGTKDSLANRLKVGMTPQDVEAIVGPSQSQIRSTVNADTVCLSYVYDEAIEAKYLHAVYVSGALSSATDGHDLPCDLD